MRIDVRPSDLERGMHMHRLALPDGRVEGDAVDVGRVTHGPRAMRVASMPAASSIKLMAMPPKRLPWRIGLTGHDEPGQRDLVSHGGVVAGPRTLQGGLWHGPELRRRCGASLGFLRRCAVVGRAPRGVNMPHPSPRARTPWTALVAIAAIGLISWLANRPAPVAADGESKIEIRYLAVTGDGPTSRAWYDGGPPNGVPMQDALNKFAAEGFRVRSMSEVISGATSAQLKWTVLLERIR